MGFYRGPKIVTDGLVLYVDAANQKSYPVSGTIWRDLSGNGNNGTLVNGPTFDSGNGGRIVFDATNESCTFPNGTFNTSLPQNGSFRIIVKIPPLSTTDATVIFYDGGATNNLIYFYRNSFWAANTYAWLIYYTKNDASIDAILPSFSYSPNTWYDLTFTFNDIGQYRVYSNGVLLNTTNASNFLSWNRTGNNTPSIGPASNQGAGNASIFQWYNRSLTAAEILQNYNAVKTRFGL